VDSEEVLKGEPEKGDCREDLKEVSDQEDDDDGFTQIWGKFGLPPDKGCVENVTENWKKLKCHIEVIWQELCTVIINAYKEQDNMTVTEEEVMLKEELVKVTNM